MASFQETRQKKQRNILGFIIYLQNTAVYFDSFGIGCIPQEVLNKIKDKSITHNVFRIQDNESSMCGFYCIAL